MLVHSDTVYVQQDTKQGQAKNQKPTKRASTYQRDATSVYPYNEDNSATKGTCGNTSNSTDSLKVLCKAVVQWKMWQLPPQPGDPS